MGKETVRGVGPHCPECPGYPQQDLVDLDDFPLGYFQPFTDLATLQELDAVAAGLSKEGHMHAMLRHVVMQTNPANGGLVATINPIIDTNGNVHKITARDWPGIKQIRPCWNGSAAKMGNFLKKAYPSDGSLPYEQYMIENYVTEAEHASLIIFVENTSTGEIGLLMPIKDKPTPNGPLLDPDFYGGSPEDETGVGNYGVFAMTEGAEEIGFQDSETGMVYSLGIDQTKGCFRCMIEPHLDELREARGVDTISQGGGHIFLQNYPNNHELLIAERFAGPDILVAEGEYNPGVFFIPQAGRGVNIIEVAFPIHIKLDLNKMQALDKETDMYDKQGKALARDTVFVPLSSMERLLSGERNVRVKRLGNAHTGAETKEEMLEVHGHYPMFASFLSQPERARLLFRHFDAYINMNASVMS